jgi:hypothetical protein
MNRSSGNILLLLVGAFLLLYTAGRSVHIVQSTLPPGEEVMGYSALAGLDGALIAWVAFKMRSARGDKQHAIAMLMIVLQLFGLALTVIGDTVLTADPAGAPDQLRLIVLWMVPAVIVSNVAATVAVHLADPGQEITNAKRALEDELERQVAEYIRNNMAQLAATVAPTAAQHRAAELLASFTATGSGKASATKPGPGSAVAVAEPAMPARRSKNGKAEEVMPGSPNG